MTTPSSMPQRRPVHPVRPPLETRAPEWHCPLRIYTSPEQAGGPVIKCPRHNGENVWHLTSQDQEGRTA